ncbi:MAG: phosphate acyltransferase [Candidatus Sulfotelmatobacter sp.]
MIHKAQANPKQVVFPEGDNEKILRASHALVDEKIGKPILLGNAAVIQARAQELGVDVEGMQIVDPVTSEHREAYALELFRLRQRRGVTLNEAHTLINDRNVFGSMMVRMGDADALVSGVTQHFPDTIRPALQIIRMREGLHRVSGCYVVITRKGEVFFLADASVNIEPTTEDLVEIALCTAHMARRFDISPRVAMLSFSSFGAVDHPICTKVRKAVELIKYADPTLIVDGEIAADDAVSPDVIEQQYPFSALKGGANVLIFPDLASANIATKLLAKIGGGETIGPILMGMSRPVHVLQRAATVEHIVSVAAIAVVDAQESDTYSRPHVHVPVEPELVGED